MRRLSAVVALLALSRLSLSSVAGTCNSTGDATEQHRHGSTAATPAAAHDHDAADEKGGGSDCSHAQHDSCPSMSSCTTAFLPDPVMQAPDACAVQRVVAGVTARVFERLRAPEPPPPRA